MSIVDDAERRRTDRQRAIADRSIPMGVPAVPTLVFGPMRDCLIMAAIGLYGVLAFQVARRGREIGIRVALGAGSDNIVGLVLKEVGVLLVLGGAVGLAAGLSVTHLVRSQLYGVSPQDPATFATAIGLLTLFAMLAAALPAFRAAKTDPIRALRYE